MRISGLPLGLEDMFWLRRPSTQKTCLQVNHAERSTGKGQGPPAAGEPACCQAPPTTAADAAAEACVGVSGGLGQQASQGEGQAIADVAGGQLRDSQGTVGSEEQGRSDAEGIQDGKVADSSRSKAASVPAAGADAAAGTDDRYM